MNRDYIGGSDLGDILSIAPYGCARRLVWEKREPSEDIHTGHTKRGRMGEQLAADEYAKQTGRELRRINREFRLPSPMEFCVGHIDRQIVTIDMRGPGVLEIKCPSQFAFRRAKQNGLSQAYVCQLQWYLLLTGRRWGAFALFNLDSWELLHFDVDADAELQKLLLREAESWWVKYQHGPLPDALAANTRQCWACQYFDRCHAEDIQEYVGELEREDSPEFGALLNELAEADEIAKDADEYREQLREKIKATVGSRPAVEAAGFKVYFRAQQRKSIDAAKVRSIAPEIAAQCEKTTTFRSLRIFKARS